MILMESHIGANAMTLRRRLLVHSTLIVLGLIAIGLYTEHQLDTVNGKKRALQEEWEELDRSLEISAQVHEVIWAIEMGNTAGAHSGMEGLHGVLTGLSDYQGEQKSDIAPRFSNQEMAVLSRFSRSISNLDAMIDHPLNRISLRDLQREIEGELNDFNDIAKEEMVEVISQIHDTEDLLDKLLWIWLVAIIGGLFASAMLLRARVVKPLRSLSDGAAALRGRHFEHRVTVQHADEIGEVAEAFNAMSGELGELYTSLEDKVAAQAEEIQRSMAELERSMRLATIGTLAAGVAHEINNPLEAITVRTDGMKRRAENDDMREGLGLIADEAARCREITNRLLDFARQRGQSQKRGSIEEINLANLLRDAVQMVSLRERADRRIDMTLPETGPVVHGEATALRQVFLNLLLNAADATENGGRIEIRARENRDGAVIEIVDTGDGIDPADLPHLFDPFYSTKGSKGTGLGLSVSHGIVNDHGGTIEVLSDGHGRGATVRVTLPRSTVNHGASK